MSAIAQEVSRRMTPGYAKERVKEMARERAYEARERAVESPWMLPLLGAGIGALVGRAILGRAQERRERAWRRDRDWPRRYGSHETLRRDRESRSGAGYSGPETAYGYGSSAVEWDEDVARAATEAGDRGVGERFGAAGAGVSERASGAKERIAGKAGELGDRASEMKDRLGAKAGELGDRASEMKDRLGARAGELGDRVRERAGALRERIPDREAIRSSAYEQPGLWALGAAAVGALFGFALPLTQREREVLAPAKEKVREATHQAMDRATEKVEEMGAGNGEPGGRGEGEGAQAGEGQSSPGTAGLLTDPPGPAPIH